MDAAFYWLGVGVAGVLVALVAAAILGAAYLFLIHERFGAILFRKGQRRLSLTSWHHTRMFRGGDDDDSKEGWPADDFPIGERPLYLSYRIGQRRLFFLAGFHGPIRYRAIGQGTHP